MAATTPLRACHHTWPSLPRQSCGEAPLPIEPTTLVLAMPSARRVPTVLDNLSIGCMLHSSLRLIALVAPGELDVCSKLCVRARCQCVSRTHPPEFQHRNLAALADGRRHVLFSHADMWVNLSLLVRSLRTSSLPETMTPGDGLRKIGFGGGVLRDRCLTPAALNTSDEWYWWWGAKEKCRRALARTGITECCYAWADLVYLPRQVHRTFREAVDAFADVFHEVAIPTILRALDRSGQARWRTASCEGSCCSRVVAVSPAAACSHRIDLREPAELEAQCRARMDEELRIAASLGRDDEEQYASSGGGLHGYLLLVLLLAVCAIAVAAFVASAETVQM